MSEYSDITTNFNQGNLFSQQANVSVASDKSRLRKMVKNYIQSNGDATSDEVEAGLRLSHQTVSARFTELKARGEIELTGKRPTRSGRMAGVYKVVDTTL